jgi:hypothetical protein
MQASNCLSTADGQALMTGSHAQVRANPRRSRSINDRCVVTARRPDQLLVVVTALGNADQEARLKSVGLAPDGGG